MLGRLTATLAVIVAAEDAVVKFSTENFDSVIADNKFVLAKFFAPWCGHCKAMAADYVKAAEQLAADSVEVVLGEVDATVEQALATKYEVQGYPTILWFVKGNKREYGGPRTADGLVEWVKNNMGPALKTWTEDELKKAKEERGMGDAMYVFQGDSSVEEVAGSVADSGKAIAQIGYIKGSKNSVTVFRGADESVTYSGKFEAEAVSEWVANERAPHFGKIHEDNFEIYVDFAKKGLFWVCLDPATREEDLKTLTPELVAAAKAQKEDAKYPFVWLDIAEFEAHAKEELGCSTFPTVVLQRGDLLGDREDTKVDKFVRTFSDDKTKLNAAAVKEFFADIESGKLEAVPEPDELAELDDDDAEDDLGDDDDSGEDKEEL